MSCIQTKQAMILGISDEKIQSHLKNCGECNQIDAGISHSMQLLDEPVVLPLTLYEGILSRKEISFTAKEIRRDYSLFFQFSTIIAAAIMLGVVLGFHANTQLITSKQRKKSEALIEFKAIHHLNVDHQRLF